MLADCLADKAVDYFMSLPSQIQGDYKALLETFKNRFDPQVNPGQILKQLQTLRQTQGETIQKFSQRVRFTVALAVNTFLEGVTNATAAVMVMDKQPSTLDHAVTMLERTITNHRVLLRRDVKSRQLELDVPELEELEVRRFENDNNWSGRSHRDQYYRYSSSGRGSRTGSPWPTNRDNSPYRDRCGSRKRDWKNCSNGDGNSNGGAPLHRFSSPSKSDCGASQRNKSPVMNFEQRAFMTAMNSLITPSRVLNTDNCYICGQLGHYSCKCPLRTGERALSPAGIIRDPAESPRPAKNVAFKESANGKGSA